MSGLHALVVIEADGDERERILELLDPEAEVADGPSIDAFIEWSDGAPVVIVFGPSFTSPQGLREVEQLLADRAECEAVLATTKMTATVLQRALRAGVRDVVHLGTGGGETARDADELAAAIERAGRSLGGAAAGGARPPQAQDVHRGAGPCRVVTVLSTKGGSGKSVVATNLGIALARRTSRPVALVDVNLQFGDVAVLMKLQPEHTIVDAAQNIHQLDEGLLRGQLQRHEASGLWVLPAPAEPSLADEVSAADVVKVIEVLRGFCEIVVIDTPGYFNDVVLSVLENTDEILLVVAMDIPSIKNARQGLQVLKQLGVSARIRLVLNRANSRVRLDVGEVLKTLQLKADALVPSEISVPQSCNRGVPVVLDAPKSGAAAALEGLADGFLRPPVVAAPQRRGRRGRGR